MADTPVGYDGNPLTPTNGGPAASSDSDFWAQLAKALAAAGGAIGGRAIANSQGNPMTQAVPPQLSQLLDQSVQRQAYQNPLFQATTQGVYDMLPDFAKNGTALSGTLPNTVQPPSAAGASGGPGLGTAAALGGGSALAAALQHAGSGSGGDLSKIFEAIRKKFGGQIPGLQGNQPFPGGALPSGNPNMNGFTGWDPNGNTGGGSGQPYLPSDPGVYWGQNGGGAQPTDPSGGTGIGPGMQAYYDWLNGQGNGSGSAPTETFGMEPGWDWGG